MTDFYFLLFIYFSRIKELLKHHENFYELKKYIYENFYGISKIFLSYPEASYKTQIYSV